MILTQDTPSIDTRIHEVIATHFDPKWGTPYWIKRAGQLAFDPRKEIRSVSDLPKMGLMEPAALHHHSIEHYIPKRLLSERRRLILAQTGGTLGSPAWTAYLDEEFDEAFVEPFVAAARHVGFPEGLPWLYVGPSGPHIIGRAAEAIARRTGSAVPFTVDFDSRWVRKLPTGSFAAQRYMTHVVDQAMAILTRQSVGVLFTTPPVLHRLAKRMSSAQRESIRGVHYGGLPLDADERARFQREMFPGAVHLSGYGNTLFGCCLELTAEVEQPLRYFPHGHRLVLGVLPGGTEEHRRPVYQSASAQGRVVFSRLDYTMMLVNVVERDVGFLVQPPAAAPAGFSACGVASPHPADSSKVPPGVAIY